MSPPGTSGPGRAAATSSGSRSAGPATLNDATGEVLLDIETIRAIAPAATILNVEAGPGVGFDALLEAIEQDGRADIVSISYTYCERWDETRSDLGDWRGYLRFLEGAFASAAASGMAIFVSSGDEGVFGCVRSAPEEFHDLVSAGYPSTDPAVVSVGGTSLWRHEDGSYHREAAWVGPMSGEGSGGGPSLVFGMPDWQQDLGLGDASSHAPHAGCRRSGGPGQRRAALDLHDALRAGRGGRVRAGPLRGRRRVRMPAEAPARPRPSGRALTALVRQAAQEEGLLGEGRIGPLGQLLYQIAEDRPEAFHDIVSGSNLLEPAGPGWDAATGLGSPDAPSPARGDPRPMA